MSDNWDDVCYEGDYLLDLDNLGSFYCTILGEDWDSIDEWY